MNSKHQFCPQETNASSARTDEHLLTRDELAARLRMSRRGVQDLTKRRMIPVIRLGRKCVRYDYAKVKAALEKFEVKAIS